MELASQKGYFEEKFREEDENMKIKGGLYR